MSRDFYVKHFKAKAPFGCGRYVNLEFGNQTSQVQFMAPQLPEQKACNPAGLTYNFAVGNVDLV